MHTTVPPRGNEDPDALRVRAAAEGLTDLTEQPIRDNHPYNGTIGWTASATTPDGTRLSADGNALTTALKNLLSKAYRHRLDVAVLDRALATVKVAIEVSPVATPLALTADNCRAISAAVQAAVFNQMSLGAANGFSHGQLEDHISLRVLEVNVTDVDFEPPRAT